MQTNKQELFFCPVFSCVRSSRSYKCSTKQMLLKISQDLQEKICAGVSFLIKFQAEDIHSFILSLTLFNVGKTITSTTVTSYKHYFTSTKYAT